MGDLDLEGVRSFGAALTIVALFGRDAVWSTVGVSIGFHGCKGLQPSRLGSHRSCPGPHPSNLPFLSPQLSLLESMFRSGWSATPGHAGLPRTNRQKARLETAQTEAWIRTEREPSDS